MAQIWQTFIVNMVRSLINDVSEDPVFSDLRIQEAVCVAGLICAQEYEFTISYSFDMDQIDIVPDPVDERDNLAIALFALKTACILNMNQYQNATGAAIKVRDGDSQIDTTGSFGGYRDILELGPCASYQKLLKQKQFKKSMGSGRAIMTPLSSPDFYQGTYGSVSRFYDTFRFGG